MRCPHCSEDISLNQIKYYPYSFDENTGTLKSPTRSAVPTPPGEREKFVHVLLCCPACDRIIK